MISEAFLLRRQMLLQRVDEWHLAHVLGQVVFFDQAPQSVSGCGFRIAEDCGGFFDGDPCSPAVAVAEGVDIDEVEVGGKGANQTLILLLESPPRIF